MTDSKNHCVCVDWYEYKGQCPITTCKFNTAMLTTGCLALERKDTHGKKLLTDRELRYYKFNNEVPVNAVTAHRKKVYNTVKKVIALYYYVQYVLNNCTMRQFDINKDAAKLLTKFPLKLKKLNVSPILLENMLVESNFAQYKRTVRLEDDYSLNDLFLIHQKEWTQLNITHINNTQQKEK